MRINKKKERSEILNSGSCNVEFVKMALKLIVGLGLIEIIGFIQTGESKSVFSIVRSLLYNLVRSLRGLFVFIIFVLNRRILKLYREKLDCRSTKIETSTHEDVRPSWK